MNICIRTGIVERLGPGTKTKHKSKDEAMGQSVSQSLVQSTLSDQPGTLSLHFQLFNVNYEDGVLIWN